MAFSFSAYADNMERKSSIRLAIFLRLHAIGKCPNKKVWTILNFELFYHQIIAILAQNATKICRFLNQIRTKVDTLEKNAFFEK